MLPEVESWFGRRSYAAADYDAAALAGAKDGRRLSVILPARDEEATVGGIVTALRRRLMEQVPLLDEIVVIDSDSEDRTAEVAAAAGARVHRQDAILPELGNVPGKGEALWKSLAVAEGDLLAFVDADLWRFDPEFVTGLFGPLLTEPGVEFVKGCFDRPLDDGRTVLPAGGGRVTELVARPLLNAWWPLLAGFVQPLGGEYAGTREVLSSVPFAAGYGVDIGLLVDLVDAIGLDAMAQVDLGVRRHHHSPDDSLVLMAAQIQQTVHGRLVSTGRLTHSEPPATSVTTFRRAGAVGPYVPTTVRVGASDRPPMSSIPAGSPAAATHSGVGAGR